VGVGVGVSVGVGVGVGVSVGVGVGVSVGVGVGVSVGVGVGVLVGVGVAVGVAVTVAVGVGVAVGVSVGVRVGVSVRVGVGVSRGVAVGVGVSVGVGVGVWNFRLLFVRTVVWIGCTADWLGVSPGVPPTAFGKNRPFSSRRLTILCIKRLARDNARRRHAKRQLLTPGWLWLSYSWLAMAFVSSRGRIFR
jgi:hypothetical protein